VDLSRHIFEGASNMSVQEMEKLDDKGMTAWDTHDLDGWVGMFADKFEWTDDTQPEPIRTKDGARQYMQAWITAFPDMHVKVLNRVVADDSVGTEVEFSGTNSGPMNMGGRTIPPTNKKVKSHGTYFAKAKGGKIVEFHSHPNVMEMMTQLGISPS
jgi:predicted ester cyclase